MLSQLNIRQETIIGLVTEAWSTLNEISLVLDQFWHEIYCMLNVVKATQGLAGNISGLEVDIKEWVRLINIFANHGRNILLSLPYYIDFCAKSAEDYYTLPGSFKREVSNLGLFKSKMYLVESGKPEDLTLALSMLSEVYGNDNGQIVLDALGIFKEEPSKFLLSYTECSERIDIIYRNMQCNSQDVSMENSDLLAEVKTSLYYMSDLLRNMYNMITESLLPSVNEYTIEFDIPIPLPKTNYLH